MAEDEPRRHRRLETASCGGSWLREIHDACWGGGGQPRRELGDGELESSRGGTREDAGCAAAVVSGGEWSWGSGLDQICFSFFFPAERWTER